MNKIAIAPMIDWTDRHYRRMMRLISKHIMLYTEMVTTNAIIHGNCDKLLKFNPEEHPLTLQLGGNDPKDLSHCAKLAEMLGFDEINLNVGCPSDRVKKGAFGLSLMYTPDLVADCVRAMKAAVSLPVSVKCRTGVDERDDYEHLQGFIDKIIHADADHITIHARKGWLNGLSPKENRTIPPLDYELVYTIKRHFPNSRIGINGGIESIDAVKAHLKKVDAVMIGRKAYHEPMFFKDIDAIFYGEKKNNLTPFDVAERLIPYIETELSAGEKLHNITRHTLNLFNGCPGARAFRRHLSENATKDKAGIDVFKQALAKVHETIQYVADQPQ
ncbi:MAG: tRNA dihydrouridine(20/20a) synthase DusA [Francisellaceae bacterium]